MHPSRDREFKSRRTACGVTSSNPVSRAGAVEAAGGEDDEEHLKGADSRHGGGGDGGHVERACLLRQNRTARNTTIHGKKKTRSDEVV